MHKLLRRSAFIIAVLLLFSQIAMADSDVLFPISQSKLNVDEVKAVFIEHFARRCNLPWAEVEKAFEAKEAKDGLQFGLFGYGYLPDASTTPVWQAHLRLHGGVHYALLNAEGEILYWQSHGTEHYRNEPDVWETAVTATPLKTDASEDQILSDVKLRLMENTGCSKTEIEDFDYRMRFVYEKHFNEGNIPVWLTYVYDDNMLIYKQVNGYDGSFMCLNTPEEDFGEYRTNLPSFIDTMNFPHSDWWGDTMTIEEKAMQAEYWRPAVEQWLKDYPYSEESLGLVYDVTLRQTFGVPDDEAITQREAEQIARDYASHLGFSDLFFEQRKCRANYLVTDPEKPIWRILVRTPEISMEESKKYWGVDELLFREYVVEIDAYTRELVFATIVDVDTPRYLWQY